jgi:hypothetical protein
MDLPPRPNSKRNIIHRAISSFSTLFSSFLNESKELDTEEELRLCGFSSQEIADLRTRQESWDGMQQGFW